MTSADAVILDHSVKYVLADTRNWTERHRVRKQIRTERGRRLNAVVKVNFNPVWEDVRLIKATVRNGDRIREIRGEECILTDAEWATSAPRYPHGKTLVINLPEVEVGSILDYAYQCRKKDRVFFSATHLFRDWDPIRHKKVVVVATSGICLQCRSYDAGVIHPDDTIQTDSERVIHAHTEDRTHCVTRQWWARRQAGIRHEQDMAPLCGATPVLRITCGNWKAYAEEVHTRLRIATRGQTEAGQRAREIARQADGQEGRIGAIRDYVARSIRNVEMQFSELPLSAITPADETLRDGYGNAADRAVLLYCMLQAVGQDPEFVLASNDLLLGALGRFETQYPDPEAFGRMLVRLRCNSLVVHVNDTNEHSVLGTTPSARHLALSLDEGRIRRIAVPRGRRDLVESEYQIRLTIQGDADLAVTNRLCGTPCGARKEEYMKTPSEDRHRCGQKLITGVSRIPYARVEFRADYESYPAVETCAARIDKAAVHDQGYLYMSLPSMLSNLFGLRGGRRTSMYQCVEDRHHRKIIAVHVPEGYSIAMSLPKDRRWILPAHGMVRMRIAQQEDSDGSSVVLRVEQEVRIRPFYVEPERCAELAEIERQIHHAWPQVILFVRKL
jgi:hypothetical protein